MSALLRRRKEALARAALRSRSGFVLQDWTPVQAPAAPVPAEVPDAQGPRCLPPCCATQPCRLGLSVSTNKARIFQICLFFWESSKVFSLFHECPASPKRVKPATVAA